MRTFLSVFPAVLSYGLDAFTLTDKRLSQIDGFFFRFLRRMFGIPASYYSRVSNQGQAQPTPQKSSKRLSSSRFARSSPYQSRTPSIMLSLPLPIRIVLPRDTLRRCGTTTTPPTTQTHSIFPSPGPLGSFAERRQSAAVVRRASVKKSQLSQN